jgi:hypothetical protein
MAICQAIFSNHRITFSNPGRSDPAKQTEKRRVGVRAYQKSKIWGVWSLISTHRSSIRSSSSTHAWRIVAADAPPRAPLILSRSITVRVGQTSSKNSGMTAGVPPADGGNGSPAMGPEMGEIKIIHAHIRAGKGRAYQKLVRLRGPGRGSCCQQILKNRRVSCPKCSCQTRTCARSADDKAKGGR